MYTSFLAFGPFLRPLLSVPCRPNGGVEIGGFTHDSLDDCIEYHMDNPLVGRDGKLYLRKPATSATWYVGGISRALTERAVLAAKVSPTTAAFFNSCFEGFF